MADFGASIWLPMLIGAAMGGYSYYSASESNKSINAAAAAQSEAAEKQADAQGAVESTKHERTEKEIVYKKYIDRMYARASYGGSGAGTEKGTAGTMDAQIKAKYNVALGDLSETTDATQGIISENLGSTLTSIESSRSSAMQDELLQGAQGFVTGFGATVGLQSLAASGGMFGSTSPWWSSGGTSFSGGSAKAGSGGSMPGAGMGIPPQPGTLPPIGGI